MEPASWVIYDKQKGRAVFETYCADTAEKVRANHAARYDVLPIADWLASINKAARQP